MSTRVLQTVYLPEAVPPATPIVRKRQTLNQRTNSLRVLKPPANTAFPRRRREMLSWSFLWGEDEAWTVSAICWQDVCQGSTWCSSSNNPESEILGFHWIVILPMQWYLWHFQNMALSVRQRSKECISFSFIDQGFNIITLVINMFFFLKSRK